MNISQRKVEVAFEEYYEEKPDYIFFAPGRVNLIGEHIDYNGGLVFPCALTVGTFLAIRKRKDTQIRLRSLNFEEHLTLDIAELDKTGQWFDYPIGIIKSLLERGMKIQGVDILYLGTIPNGAGLSSSASIEVVTAYALNTIYDGNLNKVSLVQLSQEVENKYIGVNCGIMDQFAVGFGKENHAIALDCNTLEASHVPMHLGDYTLIIGNTNVQRKLADSKYNERLRECKEALEIAQKKYKIANLCELDTEKLEEIASLFDNELIFRRASHVVSEQERVLSAVSLLKQGDLEAFGGLMNASHDSLRDDYEVTGNALDTMVEEGRKIEGVLGTRMTGAGFGGCTVTLLHKDSVSKYIDEVSSAYENKLNIKPEFYNVGIGDGVKEIKTIN